jgi:hypothetical protein
MDTSAVQGALDTAKGISDYGFLVVFAGFFIILTLIMWVGLFNFVKNSLATTTKNNQETAQKNADMVTNLLSETKIQNEQLVSNANIVNELLKETRKQNDMLNDLAEGLRSETQLRIKNLSNALFDNSMYECFLVVKKVKKENHIADKEKTDTKIRKLLANIFDNRNSKFDNFTYRGQKLSKFTNPEWVNRVTEAVEQEIYADHEDENRTLTNLKMVYDGMKIEFYNALKEN